MGYWGMLERRWLEPSKLFRRWSIRANHMSRWTMGGERWWTHVGMMADFQLQSMWGVVVGAFRHLPKISPEALRGGPGLREAGYTNGWLQLRSDPRKRIGMSFFGGAGVRDQSDGYDLWLDPSLELRPSAQISVALTPSVSWARNPTQYVTQGDVVSSTHYFVGEIEQRTVSLTARLSCTFTPTLSLQFYAQPFVSAGSYDEFKQVLDPKATAFDNRFQPFGPDEIRFDDESDSYHVDLDGDRESDLDFDSPDFNFKALNANLVLRWEYRPGSTLFVVWNQSRGGSSANGSFSLWRDMGDLYRLPSVNSFIVKLSYWLGR